MLRSMSRSMPDHNNRHQRAAPFINVTPLIDVLLVLLIIFMVVAPLKQSRFEARLPAPPPAKEQPPPEPNQTLLVRVGLDHRLQLNALQEDLGTIEDPGKLEAKLSQIFYERERNHAYNYELINRADLADQARIELTVFVMAPQSMSYGDVAKVIDSLKVAGAAPIGLQVDGLN